MNIARKIIEAHKLKFGSLPPLQQCSVSGSALFNADCMDIVKNTSKTWGDIVKKLSTHVELDDKEKAGFFVGGEFSSEKRKDEF